MGAELLEGGSDEDASESEDDEEQKEDDDDEGMLGKEMAGADDMRYGFLSPYRPQ